MHDYVVIGAGSAGCVVAARLSERGAKVLLLEAGGPDDWVNIHVPPYFDTLMDSPIDWGYRTVPQTELLGRKIFLTRGKVLGGTSCMNAMVYMRGNRGDYDHWRQLGNTGWGYGDVLPYFTRSEGNQRYKDEYHGNDGPLIVSDPETMSPLTRLMMEAAREAGIPSTKDVNGATQEGYGQFQRTIGKTGRCSTARAFLHPATQRKNLTVITYAHATRLLSEKGRVTGVAYLHNGQLEQASAANETILCGGAINSPQLLLLSGIGPVDELRTLGITPVHDLPGVGKNLHDHLYVSCRFQIDEPYTPFGMSAAEAEEATRQAIVDGVGPLATNFIESGAFIRLQASSEFADVQFHFERNFGVNYFDGSPLDRHGFNLSLNVCRPQSRGDLRLFSANPLDKPLIDPRYLTEPIDMELTLAGTRKGLEIGNAKVLDGIGRKQVYPAPEARTDAELIDYIRRTANTVWHPVGTCKMGNDPMAVVDDRLRVRGLQGLRVADASIMPTIPSGNTNAPCIMIGEKAADLVLAA
jgi:choline dehydrogenase